MDATMSVPLHLKPTDWSTSACLGRLLLHQRMALLNPRGFRTPRRAVKLHSRSAMGNRDKRSIERTYRIDGIATLAILAGKERLPDSLKSKGEKL